MVPLERELLEQPVVALLQPVPLAVEQGLGWQLDFELGQTPQPLLPEKVRSLAEALCRSGFQSSD